MSVNKSSKADLQLTKAAKIVTQGHEVVKNIQKVTKNYLTLFQSVKKAHTHN